MAACVAAGYAAYVYVPPMLRGTGCEASTARGSVGLTLEQAENAATIAAVARREDLPRRAVTVALAAALQESKLRNLPYGDRDSVGLFQQRPSQGWGRRPQLLDPVYATTQFYETLTSVSDYRSMPIHEAAQAVQRSADGTAYAQHATEATVLSAVLTGVEPAGLRCWFRGTVGEFDLRRLQARLTRELGSGVRVRTAGPGVDVPVSGERLGWAVAAWAVANDGDLGIAAVGYGGREWTAADGHEGWQPADTPTNRVLIRGPH